jgi:hypothetical protein
MTKRAAMVFSPVGDTLENGFDAGGARIYPFSTGLAINPPAYYSNYQGTASGLPVAPPVSALSGTAGAPTNTATQALAHPWGMNSPLPWVVGGLLLAVGATHVLHYRDKK